jgi:3-hydroxybutyryl-CoA dehydrogenase
MQATEIEQIAVVGAGTMGATIGQLAAQAGRQVILYDISNDALTQAENRIHQNLDGAIERKKIQQADKDATLQRLSFTTSFTEVQGQLILEAIAEDLSAKQALFEQLDRQNPGSTIFATNTSSIPITRIAAGVEHPERVIGMHFCNPAHVMKLVEVISGNATSGEVAAAVFQLATEMGKEPVYAADSPGFIVNRIARHFYVESLKVLEEQVSTVEGIDRLMEASGFRMGPFQLMDLIGVDTNFDVTRTMYEAFHYEPKFRPSLIQERKVDAGHHGRKAGKGFYGYEGS